MTLNSRGDTTKHLVVSTRKIHAFQDKVFSFYRHHKRDLPWRNTSDPYKILLSELMLQQTQVARVVNYYTRWVTQWPTIHDLAAASRAEVLKAWMGLGYNTRAVHLHKAAQKIVDEFHGDVLNAMEHYQEIPGVGRYTAHAVQIFSTNKDMVTVDTNIRRIFISEFHLPETTSDTEIWALATRCLPHGHSRDWHNALMDYGALHLTAKKTGIKPKTQQPRFQGSDRQVRAQIMRLVLDRDASFADIQQSLRIDATRLQQILEKLIHEHLLEKENERYHVSE